MTAAKEHEPPEQHFQARQADAGAQPPLGDEERLARLALMRIYDPADERIGSVLQDHDARYVLARVQTGKLPIPKGASWAPAGDPAHDLRRGRQIGARFVIPGDPEWPPALDDLGACRPYGLWLHGTADLADATRQSVAVVGTRAGTPYGVHVAAYLASDLSDRGWAVVSGGAHGIDASAHRGALTSASPTVVVLPGGIDVPYPAANEHLLNVARRQGVLVSECPPGVQPTRRRFLSRNRIIAALARAVVMVEAIPRSGSLNTVQHAYELGRHIGAVPGPVTSEQSRGTNGLIRQGRATCVENAANVLALLDGGSTTT